MNWLGFILGFLFLVSVDFLIYTLWKYFDMKYFSQLEINLLKEENKYLKEESKKVNGTSNDFWSDK